MAGFPISKNGSETLWLASYPRSGSTLLRLILNQAFGLPSTSSSDHEAAIWEHIDEITDLIGHYPKTAPTWTNMPGPVKTYQLVSYTSYPPDDGPAIYLVRDGRSALVSYQHYLNDIAKVYYPLEHVVLGMPWPHSWSKHVKAWDPLNRPNTLLLRYEELKDNPSAACEKISVFLQMPQINDVNVPFSELKHLCPSYFRIGDDAANINEMRFYGGMFHELHGDVMKELGYF